VRGEVVTSDGDSSLVTGAGVSGNPRKGDGRRLRVNGRVEGRRSRVERGIWRCGRNSRGGGDGDGVSGVGLVEFEAALSFQPQCSKGTMRPFGGDEATVWRVIFSARWVWRVWI
jgi:hypothetical protein